MLIGPLGTSLRSVHAETSPFSSLGYLAFYYKIVSIIYIFWILESSQIYDLQITSPIL